MPARPYWKGFMRLSLVTFPVQLYSAIETNEKVTLHQIHKPTGERVRYQKIVPDLGPVGVLPVQRRLWLPRSAAG